MFDYISDSLAYWLTKKNLIKEKHFETVALVIATVLFGLVSTSIFLAIGVLITGSMMSTIRIMVVFNTILNILNFKIQFHSVCYEGCIVLTGISLTILFVLSLLASSILTLISAPSRAVILFDIVSTVLYIKWFLRPKTRVKIRKIESFILRNNKTNK